MKSKTSCFNRTIFRKNVTRFWPLWTLYTILLFFMMPFQLLTGVISSRYITTAEELAMQKMTSLARVLSLGIHPVIPAIFSIVIALAVFSYLFQARSCHTIHALPLRRTELFFTNYISGLLFLLVPQILTFFLCIFFSIGLNVPSMEYFLHWLLLIAGISFFVFSMSSFCCMLTGHPVAAAVYFFGFNFLFVVCKALILGIISHLCYGMSVSGPYSSDQMSMPERLGTAFSPLYYMEKYVRFKWSYNQYTDVEISGFTGAYAVLIYVAAGVVLTVISIIIYQKRQLETAGDIISIEWIKPVFRWICAFVIGGLFALLISEVFFSSETFFPALFIFLLLFGFSAFFVAEMFLRKKFKVFGRARLIEWGAFAILSSLLLICLKVDVFRVADRLPEAENVEQVTVSCHYPVIFTDGQEIEEILKLHQMILDNKESYQQYEKIASVNDDMPSQYVTLTYNLKNGTTLQREYCVPFSDEELADTSTVSAQLTTIERQLDHYLSYFFCQNYKDITLTGASFMQLDSPSGSMNSIPLSSEQADQLFDALCLDLQEGNLDTSFSESDTYYNDLIFSFYCPKGIQKINDSYETVVDSFFSTGHYEESISTSETNSLSFTVNCTHIKETLEDFGISEDELITYENYFIQQDEGIIYSY